MNEAKAFDGLQERIPGAMAAPGVEACRRGRIIQRVAVKNQTHGIFDAPRRTLAPPAPPAGGNTGFNAPDMLVFDEVTNSVSILSNINMLSIGKLAKTKAKLTTATFDPTSLTWWAQKVPSLAPVSAGGQVPNTGTTGALALLDSTINGGTTAHPKGIQVCDNSGNAIDLTTYGYELLTGTPASWMVNGSNAAVTVIEANVVAFFSYFKTTTAGGANLVDQIGEHMHTCRVKLINTASGTFSLSTTINTGEVYPAGLAQSIYTSLATLQYNFTHTILESPFATLIKPGKHSLNISGGATAWATMNAMIQAVEMDLMFGPGTGITTAKTTVRCGPVAHLEAGELVQIFNLFTNRDLSKINPSERSDGTSMSGGDVTLGNDSPKENSVPANSVNAVQNTVATDATATGVTNILTHDATIGQITRLQQYGGATIQTGIIAPEYFGSGAPSSTTLPANSYYRVGDKYMDVSTTPLTLYRCTTAGTNGAAVWKKVGAPTSVTPGIYDNTQAYAVGSIVFIFTTTTVNSITIQPGCYICVAAVTANGTGNLIPQYPLPSGTAYWYCIAMGISVASMCSSSGSQQVYVNSSGTF